MSKVTVFIQRRWALTRRGVVGAFHAVRNLVLHGIPDAYRTFNEHNGFILASALAYFVILSVIPLSLISITVLSFIFQSDDEALLLYLKQMRHFLPPDLNINEFSRNVQRILSDKAYLGFIAIPFLFWIASLIFDVLEKTLEIAFQLRHGRAFWQSKLFHFALLIVIGFLLGGLSLASYFAAIVENLSDISALKHTVSGLPLLGQLSRISIMPSLYNLVFTLGLTTTAFFFIYRIVPPRKLETGPLVVGSFLASFFLEIAKYVFSFYIAKINDYTSVFGPVAAVAVIIIWVWYGCFIFVVGAEICFKIQQARWTRLDALHSAETGLPTWRRRSTDAH